MAKTTKAPSGFYTAKEVMQKLGIANSTLYHYVQTGRIKKVTPPDKKEGYYLKSEIDKMVRAKDVFILQYASDTSTFNAAQEEDMQAITDLGIELFGKSGAPSYETRSAQYRSNPEIFYTLKQDNILVGYLAIFPLKHEAIERIMSGVAESTFRTGVLTPENIKPFKPGEADEVFLLIGVRQDARKSKLYGARLISEGIGVFENFAKRGIIIKKLYATSRTRDGIELCRGLGFRQVTPVAEEDDLLRFELDLETATNPIFKNYQQIVKRVISKKAPTKSAVLNSTSLES
ncbi:MAG TPA: helix-turn-helix domain-containing protein [Ktedonobacteraceae bacterium]|nr:helix-turn-helix domain-containing protein [Ktedonobacteraceae bacterium]